MNEKKKSGEMTFKEFFEEAEKEGIGINEIEDTKNWIMDFLHRDSFSDEQINIMKMEKVWKCVLGAFGASFEQDITEAFMGLKQGIMTPQQLQILYQGLSKLKEHLQKMVKELEGELREKERKEQKEGKG